MPIIRRAKFTRFVSIGRELCQNNDLSFEARGLMAYLLSKPDDWEARIIDIERAGKIGREKRRKIVRELEDAGYLERRSTRDEKGHIDYEMLVHEIALPEEERTTETTKVKPNIKNSPWTGLPSTVPPSAAAPSTVPPSAANPSAYIEQSLHITELQEERGTHTPREARNGAKGSLGEETLASARGVCVQPRSRFREEERRAYWKAHPHLGGGWYVASASGGYDTLIADFLEAREAQAVALACIRCRGSGYYCNPENDFVPEVCDHSPLPVVQPQHQTAGGD